MTTDQLQQQWNTYLNAYADIAPAERERLLRQSVVEDVVSTNPTGETQGLSNLIAHIEQFQRQLPGASFKSQNLLAHHGQLLSQWTMYNREGAALSTAYTYARFDEQGRFTHLCGFFSPPKRTLAGPEVVR